MTDAIEKKPNRRDEAKAQTKAKILAAATKLFAEDGGYAAATIRSIAKDARMSTGAFFASYESKEDVYREIYGHPPVTPEQGARLLAQASFLANLAAESEGVAGYHLNGDIAFWDEFDEVGQARALVAEINPKEIMPCNT